MGGPGVEQAPSCSRSVLISGGGGRPTHPDFGKTQGPKIVPPPRGVGMMSSFEITSMLLTSYHTQSDPQGGGGGLLDSQPPPNQPTTKAVHKTRALDEFSEIFEA